MNPLVSIAPVKLPVKSQCRDYSTMIDIYQYITDTVHHRHKYITVRDYKFHMTRQSDITDISRTIQCSSGLLIGGHGAPNWQTF